MVSCLSVAPYVKVYLMEGKNCKEKQKTNIARRTLDPLYQQQLYFTQPYGGCILQVAIYTIYAYLFTTVNFLLCGYLFIRKKLAGYENLGF